MNAKGFVHKYGDNVDTDVIIPARYLNIADKKELATHCMEDIDKHFVDVVKAGDVMVGGFNFGCGSSREHAPMVIKESGISCVIAKTFARIFYRNAINIGLAILECPEASEKIQSGDEVAIDFDTGLITNLTKGETYQANPFPAFIKEIIQAGGLMADIKKRQEHNPMEYKLAVIPGDGIGPDVVEQTLLVLDKVGEKFGHTFHYQKVLAGGCAIDATGACLPQETIDVCKASDAVLLGAVGGWKWDTLPGDQRPERALLGLRKALGLFANLRPALLFEQLADASPLKPEILAGGLDIVVVRELTGGIYFGEKGFKDTDLGPAAYDVEQYAEEEVRRIAKVAFDMAMKRSKHVTSVDKANVLESSRLWRRVVAEVAQDYPEVTLDNLYVDNAAMQLVRNPRQFDVIVTSNIFGDILSDEASQITGSIGMLPSASLAKGNFGMYEPVHGSAPDIAGQDKANPMATILSAAMMLRYTFGLLQEADAVENAVKAVLDQGYRTPDLFAGEGTLIGTAEMGRRIAEAI